METEKKVADNTKVVTFFSPLGGDPDSPETPGGVFRAASPDNTGVDPETYWAGRNHAARISARVAA